MSGTTESAADRRSAAKLLQEPADAVAIVSDEALCRRAFVAAELRLSSPDTSAVKPVLLIRAGPMRYIIFDGRVRGGEFSASWVADTSFTIIGALSH